MEINSDTYLQYENKQEIKTQNQKEFHVFFYATYKFNRNKKNIQKIVLMNCHHRFTALNLRSSSDEKGF